MQKTEMQDRVKPVRRRFCRKFYRKHIVRCYMLNIRLQLLRIQIAFRKKLFKKKGEMIFKDFVFVVSVS